MTNARTSEAVTSESIRSSHVYIAAAACLVLGLSAGYVSRARLPQPIATHSSAPAPVLPHPNPHTPNLDQIKQMADQQAAPLLERLKSRPADITLLIQVGAIYHGSHRFKEAAAFFDKAVQADPKNVPIRTRLASSLYRSGDVDGAIAQLNKALTYDPRDANALFNLGMIRLQGQGDGKGALAAWRKLLKSNPQLSAERKAEVQKLMAEVLTTMSEPHGNEGVGK